MRTKDRLYVEYETGERELYDLTLDPYQLENLAGNEARLVEEAVLAAKLAALEGCAGQACHEAEDAP